MKSGLILEALEAMQVAADALMSNNTKQQTKAWFKLIDAKAALTVYSGIRDFDIQLEKETEK